jgi:hypothetical protein
LDGSLKRKFFEKYESVKHRQNPGWELINSNKIAESRLKRFSTKEDQGLLKNIKFLNP